MNKLEKLETEYKKASEFEQSLWQQLDNHLARSKQVSVLIMDADLTQKSDLLTEQQEINLSLEMAPAQIGEAVRRRSLAHLHFLKAQYLAGKAELEELQTQVDAYNLEFANIRKGRASNKSHLRNGNITKEEKEKLDLAILSDLQEKEAAAEEMLLRYPKVKREYRIPKVQAKQKYNVDVTAGEHTWKQPVNLMAERASREVNRKLLKPTMAI